MTSLISRRPTPPTFPQLHPHGLPILWFLIKSVVIISITMILKYSHLSTWCTIIIVLSPTFGFPQSWSLITWSSLEFYLFWFWPLVCFILSLTNLPILLARRVYLLSTYSNTNLSLWILLFIGDVPPEGLSMTYFFSLDSSISQPSYFLGVLLPHSGGFLCMSCLRTESHHSLSWFIPSFWRSTLSSRKGTWE